MPRTGRPPLTDDQVRERISAYQSRYGVKELNPNGFPVFPAGLRETQQHREWMALYQLVNRARHRGADAPAHEPAGTVCPVCLDAEASEHKDCTAAVTLVRRLGLPSLDRIRAQAFKKKS